MDRGDLEGADMLVVGQCKQCGGPVTTKSKVSGPTGVFCSEACREKHERFTERAAALDSPERKRPRGLITWLRVRGVVMKLFALVVLIAFLVVVFTEVVAVPVLTPLSYSLRGLIGL